MQSRTSLTSVLVMEVFRLGLGLETIMDGMRYSSSLLALDVAGDGVIFFRRAGRLFIIYLKIKFVIIHQ